MERAKGIEPSCEAWEAPILPLNYARRVINTLKHPAGEVNSFLRFREIGVKLVGEAGVEPARPKP